MSDHTPFLTIFPGCESLSAAAGGLDKAYVTDVQVDVRQRSVSIAAWFASMPSPVDIQRISENIRLDYSLDTVAILPEYPRVKASAAAVDTRMSSNFSKPTGNVLMGRQIKMKPVPMNTLNLESGRVAVEGDVVAVTSRTIQKSGGAVLCFDMTDRTNSVRISRFLRSDDDKSIIDEIKPGDHLIVQGEIIYSKYDDDMVLDPRNIMKSKRVIRPDNAPEKRVELHLHTRFSALDALTDPAAAVKRAAYWGMPAIAVTDHGVAQAFPDMWKAGKKEGVKIIYGMEAYYLNDMDGNSAVIGKSSLPLDTECTEIKKTFNTFVDPQRHIPPDITNLTGIRDSDVQGAPLEKEAMQMFMEFVGDRPIIAHNAHFDVGFMTAASIRQGLRFQPVFLDTLALSQALCPELKRFKLDIVSNHLGLPQFNHHRASDDAMVVARMMGKFLPMLKQQGAKTVDDIESVYHTLRRTDVAKTHHMILLVKNKVGLKNLYEMISQSYLKYFHRVPTIPKSLLLQHREGILVGSACGMGELYGAVMTGASHDELKKIASLYDYLEIQPICNNGFLVDNGRVSCTSSTPRTSSTVRSFRRRRNSPTPTATAPSSSATPKRCWPSSCTSARKWRKRSSSPTPAPSPTRWRRSSFCPRTSSPRKSKTPPRT